MNSYSMDKLKDKVKLLIIVICKIYVLLTFADFLISICSLLNGLILKGVPAHIDILLSNIQMLKNRQPLHMQDKKIQ